MDGRVEAVSVTACARPFTDPAARIHRERPLLEALLGLACFVLGVSQCVPQSFGCSGVGMFRVR